MSVRKFLKATALAATLSSFSMMANADEYYILTPRQQSIDSVFSNPAPASIDQSIQQYQAEPRVYHQPNSAYQPQAAYRFQPMQQSAQVQEIQALSQPENYNLVSEISETPTFSNSIDLVNGNCTECNEPYSACCCSTGCSTGCCETDCDVWKCIIGVEATYFWVDSNGFNNQVETFDSDDLPVGRHGVSGTDDDGMYSAPRIWIGMEKDGWGIVGRWWDFEAGNVAFKNHNPFFDPTGNSSGSDFSTYYADLELTRAFCAGSCSGQISFGGRHGQISSASSYGFSANLEDDLLRASSYEERDFEGTGLTLGLETYKSIGCGVDLFLGARGSYLWGDSSATAQVFTSLETPISYTEGGQFATAGSEDGAMVVTEVQAGVRWIHQLKCAPQVAFVRLAWEWQNWSGDNDVNAFATSTSFAVPGTSITATSNAGDQDVDLFGFALSAGLTY